MSGSAKCQHFNFHADVKVARIEDTGLKYADVTIRCSSAPETGDAS